MKKETTAILTHCKRSITRGPSERVWKASIAQPHAVRLELSPLKRDEKNLTVYLLVQGINRPWGPAYWRWHFWGYIALPENRHLLTDACDMLCIAPEGTEQVMGEYFHYPTAEQKYREKLERDPWSFSQSPGYPWMRRWKGNYRNLARLDHEVY